MRFALRAGLIKWYGIQVDYRTEQCTRVEFIHFYSIDTYPKFGSTEFLHSVDWAKQFTFIPLFTRLTWDGSRRGQVEIIPENRLPPFLGTEWRHLLSPPPISIVQIHLTLFVCFLFILFYFVLSRLSAYWVNIFIEGALLTSFANNSALVFPPHSAWCCSVTRAAPQWRQVITFLHEWLPLDCAPHGNLAITL